MASRKRWNFIHDKQNPFALPQNIAREVKSIAQARSNGRKTECMQYLWIYVTPLSADSLHGVPPRETTLATDEWLSILDESAALGTGCLVISTGEGIDKHPEILAMCSWAQETHEMFVGLHVYDKPLTAGEMEKLTSLDSRLFALFIDAEISPKMPATGPRGVQVCGADCDGREVLKGNCVIPKNMACIGPNGKMYACAYVYGDTRYAMGHCFEKELDAVMNDESIPRTIPREEAAEKRRCNGCPPLMKQMLDKSKGRERGAKPKVNGK